MKPKSLPLLLLTAFSLALLAAGCYLCLPDAAQKEAAQVDKHSMESKNTTYTLPSFIPVVQLGY